MPIELRSVLDPRRLENNPPACDTINSYTWRSPQTRQRFAKVEFSLGWELEANREAARIPDGIEITSDGSVDGDGTEYVVLPSIVRSARFSLGLLKELIHAPNLNTDKSCGFHIHIAPKRTSLIKMRLWALKCQELALAVQDTAFKAVPDARQDNSFCRPIHILTDKQIFYANKYSNNYRYEWLNVVEMFRPGGIRTVEIRLLGNTHRWKYLLAWSVFCLWLGKSAWQVVHGAKTNDLAITELISILESITAEIKPIGKSGEPIPQWVYETLDKLGIDHTRWNRPLAKLLDVEAEVIGYRKKFYSDVQEVVENENSGDDDDDDVDDALCACGCGCYPTCERQTHIDGNCDGSCYYCHDPQRCTGSPRCRTCQVRRHNNRNYCGYANCATCYAPGRGTYGLPLTETVQVRNGGTV